MLLLNHLSSNLKDRTWFGRKKTSEKYLCKNLFFSFLIEDIPRGLMARIPGFHPGGPGLIPGAGE